MMAFRDLNVEGLYQALEKELGTDIAIVIRDGNLSGEDFLGLTEDEVANMFSELGQGKKVLRLIAAKTVLTAEGQQTDNKAEVQTSPIPTAAEGPQPIASLLTWNPDIYLNTEDLQQPGGHPSSGSAGERSPSSSLATLYSAGNTDDKECHNTEKDSACTLSGQAKEEIQVSRPSLKWLLKDTASSCDEGLVQQLLNTVATMEEVLRRYQPEEICIAFNGGKDCTVLLDLFCATWTRTASLKNKKIKALYITSPNPFKDVEEFIEDAVSRYNIELIRINGEIRSALSQLKELDPSVTTILMGTRHTDPFSDTLTTFCPTDHSWPEYMRVLPLLEWSYSDVWSYLKLMQVPYCVLYNQGYTSLGSTLNTIPNPALKQIGPATEGNSKSEGGLSGDTHSSIAGAYLPAYMLTDDTLERAGRNWYN